jgi:hypothetical protein
MGFWPSGSQTDKHLTQIPFTGQLFYMTTFCIAFYESYLSTMYSKLPTQIGILSSGSLFRTFSHSNCAKYVNMDYNIPL